MYDLYWKIDQNLNNTTVPVRMYTPAMLSKNVIHLNYIIALIVLFKSFKLKMRIVNFIDKENTKQFKYIVCHSRRFNNYCPKRN